MRAANSWLGPDGQCATIAGSCGIFCEKGLHGPVAADPQGNSYVQQLACEEDRPFSRYLLNRAGRDCAAADEQKPESALRASVGRALVRADRRRRPPSSRSARGPDRAGPNVRADVSRAGRESRLWVQKQTFREGPVLAQSGRSPKHRGRLSAPPADIAEAREADPASDHRFVASGRRPPISLRVRSSICFNDTKRRRRRNYRLNPKAACPQELAILSLATFAATCHDEHIEISHEGAPVERVSFYSRREHLFEQKKSGAFRHGCSAVLENRAAHLVIPVVHHAFEDICVRSRGNGLEEIAVDDFATLANASSRNKFWGSLRAGGQIKKYPVEARCGGKQARQQCTVAATGVYNATEAAEIVRRDSGRSHLAGHVRHRRIENRPFLRVPRPIFVGVHPENILKSGIARAHAVGQIAPGPPRFRSPNHHGEIAQGARHLTA